jgi:magnesium transporter
MQALWLQQNQRQVIDWPREQPPAGEEGVLWLDLQTPTPEEVQRVAAAFHLHPAVVRGCLQPERRAKLKEYGDQLFLVLQAPARGTAQEGDALREIDRWHTVELNVVVLDRCLITLHPDPVPAVAVLWQRLARAGEGRATLDYLLYSLCEAVTSGYYVLLDRIDEQIDTMENKIFSGGTSKQLVDRLFGLKRHILQLRRTLGPQRDAISSLMRREFAIFGAESRTYFVDVYEHNLRLFDLLDTYRDLISSSLDAYLSAVSNKMNEVMKTLTIVSTVMLPLSLITGIFGMNFAQMPLLNHPYGFWLTMGAMALMGLGMVAYFRRRKWL